MYDIYLYSGCDAGIDLKEIKHIIPRTNTLSFLQRITLSSPGFLGIDVSKNAAIHIMKTLMLYGASGIYIPKEYRNPTITRAYALESGEKERQKLANKYPGMTFNPPYANPRHMLWWEVSIACKEWVDDGVIPGAVIIFVDKVDGHIWSNEDIDSFFADQPDTN